MISVKIISYNKPKIWQFWNVLYFTLFMVGFLPMVRGRSSPSYYAEIDAPWWLYIINILFTLIIGLFAFNNLFIDKTKIGEGRLSETSFEVSLTRQKKMIFEFINIKNLKFEPNYHEKTYQNETDWEIAFSYNDDLYKFNFTVEISNTAYIMQLREQITIQNSI